jgi:hypothetical protein
MHLLPLSLGWLAEHAARPSANAGFALNSIFLRFPGKDTFEAAAVHTFEPARSMADFFPIKRLDATATDTSTLVRVTGSCAAPSAEFPLFLELETAADDGTTALIPADVWKRTFLWARKLTGRRTDLPPACRSVAVRIGERETTLGVSDGTNPWFEVVPRAPGQNAPPYEATITELLRRPVSDRFAVDPQLLGDVLRTAIEVGANTGGSGVELETRGSRHPLVLRAGQAGRIELFGLLMPIALSAAPVSIPDTERLAALEQENASLRGERDELARQVEMLKAALANLR